MTRLMIIVGSVRPGRIGMPIAKWVREQAEGSGRFEVDFVDLVELNLPFMDEPEHPALGKYTKPHTIAWSKRVAAADAFLLVTPEYNYSYSPALKNALDFLSSEWRRKPVGFVSYGGVSSGTRGMVAMLPTLAALQLIRVGSNVELTFAARQIVDGVFQADDRAAAILSRELAELAAMAPALAELRRAVQG
ncbi:MAG: NAD(P)H-dependent oxidoreductase [Cryobacterium sp.]|nr:NAD(P)H-dependent oxidoreductase [Cryobacterium sp.]